MSTHIKYEDPSGEERNYFKHVGHKKPLEEWRISAVLKGQEINGYKALKAEFENRHEREITSKDFIKLAFRCLYHVYGLTETFDHSSYDDTVEEIRHLRDGDHYKPEHYVPMFDTEYEIPIHPEGI
jgi:hypothetical protein